MNTCNTNNHNRFRILNKNSESSTRVVSEKARPSGLLNLGNTCFMNAMLQVLVYNTRLREYIQEYRTSIVAKSSGMFHEFISLQDILLANSCIVSPKLFFKTVQQASARTGDAMFAGYEQNDCVEFLYFLVDQIHKETKQKVSMNIRGDTKTETDNLAYLCYKMKKDTCENQYSQIQEMFHSIQVHTIYNVETPTQNPTHNPTITQTKCVSQTAQWGFTLDLPIPSESNSAGKPKQQVTLDECMEWFFERETLDDAGRTKDIAYWSISDILVITIQRYHHNGRTKANSHVDFPLDELLMGKYVCGYNPAQYSYECVGVCNHSGRVNGGHYTSYVRLANNRWFHFNDVNVNLVTSMSEIVSPRAYCLIYRKKNIV